MMALLTSAPIHAQSRQTREPEQEMQPISSKYLAGVSLKADQINIKLDKKITRSLQQWQKQEARIKRKLAKTDSLKAAAIFGNARQQYDHLEQKLQNQNFLQHYIPGLDSLSTLIKFLQRNPQLLSQANGTTAKLNEAMSKVNGLERQLQKAEEIKKFLKQRKEYLKTQLQGIEFTKELKKLSKRVYYAAERLDAAKSLLKDHGKAERKALELLKKTRLFADFMRKNSMLASLFRLPGDPDDPVTTASLAGLQTRAQVNGVIQQTIAAGGANAQQQFQQNIQAAQSQINELKNKINQLGSGSSDVEMPEGFKPNNQKKKNFLQRLELGANMQSQKANGFFPVTSDLGISLGYKLNDRSIVGVGSSYKLGLGRNIKYINITHQGIGLRSFVDWKIKGSFWLSGGYEMNHRAEFKNIEQLRGLNAWQQSGLIGLSKVVSLKTKFFKKTKLQLLWDFLSYQNRPGSEALLFRIGYVF
ncbi:MAG TPA: hypothetical protein VJU78_13145 [Chitinophagaceae bacterium]|nr:hypothetical protein [Chitinophagaceae bacterium]